MTKKINYKNYKTAGEFYQNCLKNKTPVPLAMMWGITKIQKAKNLNFQEAYEYLLKEGKNIEIR